MDKPSNPDSNDMIGGSIEKLKNSILMTRRRSFQFNYFIQKKSSAKRKALTGKASKRKEAQKKSEESEKHLRWPKLQSEGGLWYSNKASELNKSYSKYWLKLAMTKAYNKGVEEKSQQPKI